MKLWLYTAVALGFLSWQCSPDNSAVTASLPPSSTLPVSTIDFDQSSRQLMKELAPQIVGKWNLRLVQIKYRNESRQNEINLTKDSTFQNLATLTIVPAATPRTSPVDTRRGEYDGTIEYKNKSYPVQFNMLANSEWITTKKGPQTFFLFEYRFPNGTRKPEPEDQFLDKLGVVGDNFTLETTIGQPTMIWRGLNRGVERIELVRQ